MATTPNCESGWNLNTLRVHLQFQIAENDKHLRELLTERDEALDLQAKEYERRLTDLNHAHEKALAVQHTYVTHDKYEGRLESDEETRRVEMRQIYEKLDEHKARLDKSDGRGTGFHQGWLYFLGLIGLISMILSIYTFFSR